MRRWIAVLWQASFVAIAGVLYFFFVLPRWNELTGDWSHGLGTAMRIVAGVLVGLAALPVAFTLIRTRKPEYGTPTLALSLRLWSIVLHVLGGVLIVGAAIAEIWLTLDKAGTWLFGVYGAAAAIVLLGALAFYLAYVAEMPPPQPKPLKSKVKTRGRGRRKTADEADDADEAVVTSDDDTDEESDDESPEDNDAESAAETVEVRVPGDTVVAKTVAATVPAKADDDSAPTEVTEITEATEPAAEAEADTSEESDSPEEQDSPEEPKGKLRNRRPSGKTSSRLRRRSRGGVAVED
jgi:hypothetical protein